MPAHRPTIEVLPSAKRLVNSLRDIGYDLVHAVADLIDNSIAAGAGRVEITLCFDGEESWLRIADDGSGMSGTEITEAMRFGTERDYDLDDLGKFGLGLKTASLSQCRRVSVASRTSTDSRRIEARQWDLDHVSRRNKWEVFDLGVAARSAHLIEPLENTTGTVILWERLDRVLGYKVPWGERAKTGLLQTAEQLDEHLGMVFHRYLAGEARRRKRLRITVNGTPVEPWDPFARSEKQTIAYWTDEVEVQSDNGRGLVKCAAYILPRKDQFSSEREFHRLSGPAKWNRQQGFYIYRADRLVQSGGWCWMRAADEHTKLARVALDFQPDLDTAFEINVSKAKVGLPRDLRDRLEPQIERLTKKARTVYDGAPRHSGSPMGSAATGAPAPGTPAPMAERGASQNGLPPTHPQAAGPTRPSPSGGAEDQRVTGTPSLRDVAVVLASSAEHLGESAALERIASQIRSDRPEIADALGW